MEHTSLSEVITAFDHLDQEYFTMRTLAVLAAFCLSVAAASLASSAVTIADKKYITRQKAIFQLFWHGGDQATTVLSELKRIASSYNFDDHLDRYTNPVTVKAFQLSLKQKGFLPRGAVFVPLDPDHLAQAKALFDVLYSAKDFATFYNSAVCARFIVNEGLFGYSLAVAVLHRNDTKWMKIPPIYELNPHYFFHEEILEQASRIKLDDFSGVTKQRVTVKHLEHGIVDVTIRSNYSNVNLHCHRGEEQLAYYNEDIGLNSFHFYVTHEYPSWMSSQHYNLDKGIRGELYYYVHKQLQSRYYLERLSNGLTADVEEIDPNGPIATGFYPTIVHRNGQPFAERKTGARIPVRKYKYVAETLDIEDRIFKAIETGYLVRENGTKTDNIYTSPQGLNMLANVVEGNADSVNLKYYGSFDTICRNVLGFGLDPVLNLQIAPSVLETFTATFRDPGYYRINKKILRFFVMYKEKLPRYTAKQLEFPGVHITSVTLDNFTTFNDDFDSDIGNGITVGNHSNDGKLRLAVRQQRLNHVPFTVTIDVHSEVAGDAMVKIFLGPKYDIDGAEIDLNENWLNFVALDEFVTHLKVGQNKIQRSDDQSQFVIPDETSTRTRWHQLLKAEAGKPYTYTHQVHGFPNRLLIPRGKPEGMTVRLLVVVSKLKNPVTVEKPIWGPAVIDTGRSMGYPLDRPLEVHDVPNMYWKDVKIYHKPSQ